MTPIIAQVLIGLVALVQLVIGIGEMLFWKHLYKRLQPEIKLTEYEADKITPIVKNVGLYNAFIAAGLIWGLVTTTSFLEIQIFFLSCVLLAGVFGSITLKRTTLVIQAVPSLIALIAVWCVHSLT